MGREIGRASFRIILLIAICLMLCSSFGFTTGGGCSDNSYCEGVKPFELHVVSNQVSSSVVSTTDVIPMWHGWPLYLLWHGWPSLNERHGRGNLPMLAGQEVASGSYRTWSITKMLWHGWPSNIMWHGLPDRKFDYDINLSHGRDGLPQPAGHEVASGSNLFCKIMFELWHGWPSRCGYKLILMAVQCAWFVPMVYCSMRYRKFHLGHGGDNPPLLAGQVVMSGSKTDLGAIHPLDPKSRGIHQPSGPCGVMSAPCALDLDTDK